MIRELAYELYTNHRLLAGTGSVAVLFAASVLALFLLYPKKRQIKPLCLSVLGVIAVMIAEAADRAANIKVKVQIKRYACAVFVVCLCALTITSSGQPVFSKSMSEPAENDMHIPGFLLEAMDAVLAEDSEPDVLVMPGWGPLFECYSSRFKMAYEEPCENDLSGLDEEEWILYTELSTSHPDMKRVAAIAGKRGCDFVVLSNDLWPQVPITDCGYELILETDGCSVYREVKTPR